MRTPPVSAERFWTSPPETASSSTLRKFSAYAAFLLSKDFLRASAAFFASVSAFFKAVLLGDFAGFWALDCFGMVSESSSKSSNSRNSRLTLRGECSSIQLLVASRSQNASVLSRWGVGGMRILSFVGDLRTLFEGLDGGVLNGESGGWGRDGDSNPDTALFAVNTGSIALGTD